MVVMASPPLWSPPPPLEGAWGLSPPPPPPQLLPPPLEKYLSATPVAPATTGKRCLCHHQKEMSPPPPERDVSTTTRKRCPSCSRHQQKEVKLCLRHHQKEISPPPAERDFSATPVAPATTRKRFLCHQQKEIKLEKLKHNSCHPLFLGRPHHHQRRGGGGRKEGGERGTHLQHWTAGIYISVLISKSAPLHDSLFFFFRGGLPPMIQWYLEHSYTTFSHLWIPLYTYFHI